MKERSCISSGKITCGNLWELALFFYLEGSRDQVQDVRLGDRCLHLLSYISPALFYAVLRQNLIMSPRLA